MAKKKTSLSSTLFQGIDPYGQEGSAVQDGTTVANYKLANILPDPDQPRQLLPTSYLKGLWQGQWDAEETLRTWLGETRDGGNRKANQLRELATSIAQHG